MLNSWIIAGVFVTPLLALVAHLSLRENGSQRSVSFLQVSANMIFLALTTVLFVIINQATVVQVANWQQPFCITLVFDKLTVLILLCFSIVSFCISLYSLQDKDLLEMRSSFYCGYWLLLFGVTGALSTFDIFNLYVWMEVILLSAFIILSSSQKKNYASMYHYAIFNIVGTLLLLLAIAFLYGITGSLNMAEIARFLQHTSSNVIYPILTLLLLSLAIKGGLFPFYFWLPSAYPNTSSSSTMILSSLITKTVMIVLLRLTWLWSLNTIPFFTNLFVLIACATMFLGVMGAANDFRIRNILSFHVISQLGYILLAIFIPTQWAIVAVIFFIIHNVFVKTNLFMVGGILEQQYGSTLLADIKVLMKTDPILASIFFISAMSLAGFPPLSGFWGKLLVIKESVNSHFVFSTLIAILVSLFTFYSMIKIWRFGFCERERIDQLPTTPATLTAVQGLAIAPLFLIPIYIGIFPDSILPRLGSIAADLAHPQSIINTVLGG